MNNTWLWDGCAASPCCCFCQIMTQLLISASRLLDTLTFALVGSDSFIHLYFKLLNATLELLGLLGELKSKILLLFKFAIEISNISVLPISSLILVSIDMGCTLYILLQANFQQAVGDLRNLAFNRILEWQLDLWERPCLWYTGRHMRVQDTAVSEIWFRISFTHNL